MRLVVGEDWAAVGGRRSSEWLDATIKMRDLTAAHRAVTIPDALPSVGSDLRISLQPDAFVLVLAVPSAAVWSPAPLPV